MEVTEAELCNAFANYSTQNMVYYFLDSPWKQHLERALAFLCIQVVQPFGFDDINIY